MVYLKHELTDNEYKDLFTQGMQAITDFGKEYLGFWMNSDPKGFYGVLLKHDKETNEKYILIKLADNFDYNQEAEEY